MDVLLYAYSVIILFYREHYAGATMWSGVKSSFEFEILVFTHLYWNDQHKNQVVEGDVEHSIICMCTIIPSIKYNF